MHTEIRPLSGTEDTLVRVYPYGKQNRTAWVEYRVGCATGALSVWDYTPGFAIHDEVYRSTAHGALVAHRASTAEVER